MEHFKYALSMLNRALDYLARNLSLKKIVFGIDGRPKIKLKTFFSNKIKSLKNCNMVNNSSISKEF